MSLHLCVGRRELGKTTLALYLTRNVRPRVIFDPRALVPATPRCATPEQIRAAFDALNDPEQVGVEKRAEIIVTPDSATQETFEYTCSEVKAWLQGGHHVAFIVDESTFVDLDTEPFEWIIRQAPRRAAQIVLTQHRPIDVPARIRAIVDVWCVFRTVEPRDLATIGERCTPAFAERVSKLRPREFMSWDDTKVDHNVGIFLDPAQWYVPLAAVADGSVVAGRVELPASNATLQKPLALFDE